MAFVSVRSRTKSFWPSVVTNISAACRHAASEYRMGLSIAGKPQVWQPRLDKKNEVCDGTWDGTADEKDG